MRGNGILATPNPKRLRANSLSLRGESSKRRQWGATTTPSCLSTAPVERQVSRGAVWRRPVCTCTPRPPGPVSAHRPQDGSRLGLCHRSWGPRSHALSTSNKPLGPQPTFRARRSAKGCRTALPCAEHTGPVRFKPTRPWLGRVGAKAQAAATEARKARAVRIAKQNGGRGVTV